MAQMDGWIQWAAILLSLCSLWVCAELSMLYVVASLHPTCPGWPPPRPNRYPTHHVAHLELQPFPDVVSALFATPPETTLWSNLTGPEEVLGGLLCDKRATYWACASLTHWAVFIPRVRQEWWMNGCLEADRLVGWEGGLWGHIKLDLGMNDENGGKKRWARETEAAR